MKTYYVFLLCLLPNLVFAQEGKHSSRPGIRLERIAQEIIGKRVTITFTDGKIVEGEPHSLSSSQLKLETNGEMQEFAIPTIKTITVHSGLSEYIIVAIAGILSGGLGYGVTVLSFSSPSTEVQAGIALLSAIVGAWFSYDLIASETVFNLQ